MNQEPNDQYSNDQHLNDPYSDDQYDDQLPVDNGKRRKGLFNLTGLGARLVATALAIGLGVLILLYAMRPSADPAATAEIVDSPPTATVNVTPLATWTPGATSTPPPPQNPTPVPAAPEESAPAEPVDPNAPPVLGVGTQVKVTGTEGFGVNMREGSGVTFAIIETVLDDATLEIIEGPSDGDGYTWWRVRIEDGREGWVVQDFMALVN